MTKRKPMIQQWNENPRTVYRVKSSIDNNLKFVTQTAGIPAFAAARHAIGTTSETYQHPMK